MQSLLLKASVTDSLVTLATHIIHDLGLAGIVILNITTAVIGVPGTEPVMLFAGFDVYHHHQTLIGIIVFGVIGDLLGASIAYAIGHFGLLELLERKGSPLHVSQSGLDRANAWFARYGNAAIFVSRFVPLIRSAFPYAAGVAKVPFGRFLALAAAGSLIWIGGLGILGDAVGSQWPSWRKHLEYVDYAVVVLVVGAAVYLIVRRARGQRDRQAHV
jgi:membrane protein DedA with SNARE-associated domain